jgi:SPP1 gp7 family putative phage head morphogenesis protein
MSSRLLQGILNGDSIPHIADRLMDIVGNNAMSAIRNARTMVTGAENSGRLDSYKDLAEKGVVQRKIWIATLDDRTRESHTEINGEEIEIDQVFSNGLMYPGDPDGDPSEVWNCRCSMKDHIVGFRRADGSISYIAGEESKDQEEQIEDEREMTYADLSDKNYGDTRDWFNDNSNYADWKEEIFDLEYDEEIYGYTGDYYGSVNAYLRTGNMPSGVSEDKVTAIVKELDESINTFELNSPLSVYRASGTEIFGASDLSYDDLKARIGDTVHDNAFMSTSTLRELPGEQTVGGNIRYDIIVDAGQNQGAYVASFSENKQEREFLIARNRDYLVEDVFKDEDDVIHVRLRLV